MKKLKNLNQKEIEEVNEYFLNFFAEEEKIFLENFSRLEEGFLIKAIIDEFWENFEEDEKGSIEVGKFADFIILDKDIMETDIHNIPNMKVINTYVSGEKVK